MIVHNVLFTPEPMGVYRVPVAGQGVRKGGVNHNAVIRHFFHSLFPIFKFFEYRDEGDVE